MNMNVLPPPPPHTHTLPTFNYTLLLIVVFFNHCLSAARSKHQPKDAFFASCGLYFNMFLSFDEVILSHFSCFLCKKHEKAYLDQCLESTAPKYWSKYTTDNFQI